MLHLVGQSFEELMSPLETEIQLAPLIREVARCELRWRGLRREPSITFKQSDLGHAEVRRDYFPHAIPPLPNRPRRLVQQKDVLLFGHRRLAFQKLIVRLFNFEEGVLSEDHPVPELFDKDGVRSLAQLVSLKPVSSPTQERTGRHQPH